MYLGRILAPNRRIWWVFLISFKVRETRLVGPVGLIKITLSGFSDNERSENKSKAELKSLIYNYASWNEYLISQKDNEWVRAPFFLFNFCAWWFSRTHFDKSTWL